MLLNKHKIGKNKSAYNKQLSRFTKLIKPDLTIGALTSVNKNTEVNAHRNLANKNISIAVDEAER